MNLEFKTKLLLASLLTLVFFPPPGGCSEFAAAPGDRRILQEWSFAKDLAGFRPNGEVKGLRHDSGAAWFRSEGLDPILDGPGFGPLEAANGQAIELALRKASGGRAQIFFTNTGEGPYGGFREAWSAFAEIPRTDVPSRVVVRPFWEALGKVIRIRLDPPEGEMAIEAIRIVEEAGGDGTTWGLRGVRELELDRAKPRDGLPGARAAASEPGASFLLPAGGIDAGKNFIWEIAHGPQSAPVSSILWVSAERVGLLEAGRHWTVADPGGREAIDLSGHPGWKGKITHVGFRFGEKAGDALHLSSLRISGAPSGGPHLVLLFLGPRRAVSRVGEPMEIEAHLRNIGGKIHPGGPAELILGEAVEARGMLGPLKPGETARISFWAIPGKPGRLPAALRIGDEIRRGEIRVDPPLLPADRLKGSAGPPSPAATDYQIGIYYFPGWSPDQWTRWKSQVQFPERTPELGFYREGDPEVMNWQIRWALENGITFFIFDWYWRDGRVVLDRGLHDGFLKARDRGLMKFAVMWANHDPFAGHTEKQLLEVTDFWIENYFRREEYLNLAGRPAVFFFAPSNLTRDLKGSEAVRGAFEKLRARAREAGLPGLWIAACGSSSPSGKELFAREGYDAVTAYNYAGAGSRGDLRSPYSSLMKAHEEIWKEGAGDRPIPYIPLLTVGWDSRPWHGTQAAARTGRSAEEFEAGLRSLKAHLDGGGKKMAILEAWNELGEGSDIEPTVENGFGLLEAVRKVFAREPFPANIVPRDLGITLPSIDPDLIAGWDRERISRPLASKSPGPDEGLALRCEGDTVVLLPGRLETPAGALELRAPASLRIEPAPLIRISREFRGISKEPANRWLGGTRLLDLKGRPLLPGALGQGSVEVRDPPRTKGARGRPYLRGRDWEADDLWGAVWRLEGGAIAGDSSLEVSYILSLARLDTVAVGPAGNAILLRGIPHASGARPPEPAAGSTGLFHIWIPYHGVLIEPEQVYPMGPALPEPGPEEIDRLRKAVTRTRARLDAGEAVTVLFWGGGATAGGDASAPEKAFPGLLGSRLRERFPRSKVEVVNAGIGGSSSPVRLPRFQEEVLSKKPHLAVIEFAEDMGYPPEKIREALGEAIDRLRRSGAEVILTTPHFTMPAFMGRASCRGPDPRPGVRALRDLAREKGVGLADVARRWERLEEEGIPYMTLLANGMDHPDDRGHEIYAEEILRSFR